MDKKALIVIACLVLGGCTMGARTGSLCTAGPIVLDPADQLTRSTGEQIVALNESGVKICNWKPPA